MVKEYQVIIYSEITKLEEYEYFTNKKKAIEYAKKMADENTRTSVWCFKSEEVDEFCSIEEKEFIDEF